MAKFQPGNSYYCTSVTDHACTFLFKCVDRSKNYIKFELINGERLRRKVYEMDGIEFVSPFGIYSMSPTLSSECKTKEATRIYDFIERINGMQEMCEICREEGGRYIIEEKDRDFYEDTILNVLGFERVEDPIPGTPDETYYSREKNGRLLKIVCDV